MRRLDQPRVLPAGSAPLPTRCEALDAPLGRMQLGYCAGCGLISNSLHDLHLLAKARQEELSSTMPLNSFARALARQWIERHDLHRKQLVEIGCGRGDFLLLMCELGTNYGVGVDPAYLPHRLKGQGAARVQFIQDVYSEKYGDLIADFLICRHMLQHLHDPGAFLRMLRRAIGSRREVLLGFEVPDATRMLQHGAFWDLHYAHCCYFTPAALAGLLGAAGFEVLLLRSAHGGQNIVLEARPVLNPQPVVAVPADELAASAGAIEGFPAALDRRLQSWRGRIDQLLGDGRRLVVWGAGPKTVSFLTLLQLTEAQIACVVDPAPSRQGRFLPRTGQQVASPTLLLEHRPDVLLVVNSFDTAEAHAELERQGLEAQLLTV